MTRQAGTERIGSAPERHRPPRAGRVWPAILLFAGFLLATSAANWWIYQRGRRTLDEDLGSRLKAIAGVLVQSRTVYGDALYNDETGIDEGYVIGYLDDLLQEIQRANDLDAILLLEPDNLDVAYSSNPSLYRPGTSYPHKASHEAAILESVLEREPTASPTIRVGKAGDVYLKSGFAPVYTYLQDQLVAVLVVEASADFLGVLGQLRGVIVTGILVSGGLVFLLALAYFGLQRKTARARLALEREDRMSALGKMASQVAHEIRNPVGIIKYSAERMARWLDHQDGGRRAQDPELDEMVAYIRDETQRLQDITERYLTYTREGAPHLEEIDLAEIVHAAAEALERSGVPEGIGITADAAADLPPVEGDRNLLRQVMLNLAGNALEAMGRSGQLRLFAERDTAGDGVLLGTEDSGPGIPERMRERVFEPFFSTRADGNGIGLFIVAQTARDMGGSAHVGRAPSGGARVYIRLPAAGHAPDGPERG